MEGGECQSHVDAEIGCHHCRSGLHMSLRLQQDENITIQSLPIMTVKRRRRVRRGNRPLNDSMRLRWLSVAVVFLLFGFGPANVNATTSIAPSEADDFGTESPEENDPVTITPPPVTTSTNATLAGAPLFPVNPVPSGAPVGSGEGTASDSPSVIATGSPSTRSPSGSASGILTWEPTQTPTSNSTRTPSPAPVGSSAQTPTRAPAGAPTWRPTLTPTQPSASLGRAGPTSGPATPSGTTTSNTTKPTAAPVVFSTTRPTTSPITAITPNPTRAPTDSPSGKPTPIPTKAPTRRPTIAPSGGPSISPTKAPTKRPSQSPSSFPTASPTKSPTGVPSIQPSFAPTGSPTAHPSRIPSVQPTLSQMPSAPPTHKPTSRPSSSPTSSPTAQPSVSPTGSPSLAPSSAPTRPLQEDTIFNVIMTFDDCERLSNSSVALWQQLTAQHIEDEFASSVNEVYELYDVNVTVFFVEQRTPTPSLNSVAANELKMNSGGSGRKLGKVHSNTGASRNMQTSSLSGKNPLRIRFDVVVNFRSPTHTHDVVKYVSGSFNRGADRIRYISLLQSSEDDSFNGVNTVIVEIYGIEIAEEPDPPTNPQTPNPVNGNTDEIKSTLILITIGCAAAGSVLLVVVGYALCRSRQKGGGNGKASASGTVDVMRTPEFQQEVVKQQHPTKTVSTETADRFIDVEGQEDVSTLGDPVGFFSHGFGDPSKVEGDETVGESTLNDAYDYSNNFRPIMDSEEVGEKPDSGNFGPPTESTPGTPQKNNSTRSALLFADESLVFSDDDSFEQQFSDPEERFEVECPPGKLGVIIDSAADGLPSVHQIKETSPLAGRVRVGDVIVEVDGEDTTGMSAIDVSTLISSRYNQPSRVLTLIRKVSPSAC